MADRMNQGGVAERQHGQQRDQGGVLGAVAGAAGRGVGRGFRGGAGVGDDEPRRPAGRLGGGAHGRERLGFPARLYEPLPVRHVLRRRGRRSAGVDGAQAPLIGMRSDGKRTTPRAFMGPWRRSFLWRPHPRA